MQAPFLVLLLLQDKRDVLNALSFGKIGGRTNTQAALRRVRDEVFRVSNGDRINVPNKVGLIHC